LLLDYPKGKRDSLDVCLLNEDDAEPTWTNIALRGSWYPDAFIGPMANLQRFAAGEDESLWTSVDDVYRTMAVVEACYESNESGGTPIPGSTR